MTAASSFNGNVAQTAAHADRSQPDVGGHHARLVREVRLLLVPPDQRQAQRDHRDADQHGCASAWHHDPASASVMQSACILGQAP